MEGMGKMLGFEEVVLGYAAMHIKGGGLTATAPAVVEEKFQ